MAEILVIAQDWTPRVLIRAQLEEEGHAVTGCLTLDEGLLHLKTRPGGFDAVILDTAGQTLRSQALRRLAVAGPPVLVLTGALDRDELERDGLPWARVLVRPVFVGDVVRHVDGLLAAASTSRSASDASGRPPSDVLPETSE